MSDNFLRLIPTDPYWVPDAEVAEKARRLYATLVPDASEVTIDIRDEVAFVDQGSNFESVECPSCGAALETDWWQGAMDRAFDAQFSDLSVSPPCCGKHTSLNDLRYVMPAGFARFTLEAMNPNRGTDLDRHQLKELENLLGCKLRQIWAHY